MTTAPITGRPAAVSDTVAVSTAVLAAIVTVEVAILALAFGLAAPVVPVGLLLTGLLGILILADLRMAVVGIAVTTFFVHSEITGEIFIVHLLGLNVYAMDWILLFAGFSYAYHRAAGTIRPGSTGRLATPLACFLLALPVFAGVGLAHGHTVQQAAADSRLFFYYISYFVVAATVRDRPMLALAFWSVLLLGAAGAIPEIIWSVTHPQVDRLTGKLLGFGRLTGASEVNYPMMLAASVVAWPHMDSFPKRAVLGAVAGISATALFLSYWRGSWLAAGLGVILALALYGSSRGDRWGAIKSAAGGFFILSSIVGILGLAGAFTLDDLLNRLGLVSFRRVDVSSLQRVVEWLEAWRLFLADPLFGAGFGHYYTFFSPGVGSLNQVFIHNSYMYVLSKAGAVGLVLFMALFLRSLVVSRRTARRLMAGPTKGYYLAFCAMLLVLMVKALTTWHLNSLTTSLFVGMILGVLGAKYFDQTGQE